MLTLSAIGDRLLYFKKNGDKCQGELIKFIYVDLNPENAIIGGKDAPDSTINCFFGLIGNSVYKNSNQEICRTFEKQGIHYCSAQSFFLF